MFCRREPEDLKSIDADRDVFNERPSKEDIISSTEAACKFIFINFLFVFGLTLIADVMFRLILFT